MLWMRDEKVEQRLDRYGVAYEYVEKIPLTQVNIEKGRRNNTRLYGEHIDEDTALQYGLAMEDKAARFPACVLVKNGKGFDVEDGNHRIYGMDIAKLITPRATIDAYVLKTKVPAEKALVMRSLNVLNGKPLTREERVDHCLELLKDFPDKFTQASVAEIFGLKTHAVSEAARVNDISLVLENSKIKTHLIPKTAIIYLGGLSQNEAVMVQAAALVEEYELTCDETKELVAGTRARKSEAQQRAYLEKMDTDFQASSSVKPLSNMGWPDQKKALRCIARLNQILHRNPGGLRIKDSDTKAQARHLWEVCVELGNKAFAR